ncbi:hypothetical protein LTR84_006398 [Exophiala bonariae]|uniref:MARVEL domain-containing protein n=1 Tax=Exophiala bonariae TaxID=1690606 RepID=A0AAV9N1S8_9EURO|nr:hypothetical protein LTR84_006398 [Exophiala bonariae]
MEHSSSTLRPSTESHATTRPPSSTQKDETYQYKAVTVIPSPLMTASLNSRHSATSVQESTYLSQARWLRRSRLALTVLIIGTGVAAVACSGHIQHSYNSTHLGPEYHLTLWPINIDLRPNLVILNSAAIVIASSIGYLVFSLLPSPHSRNVLYNIFFAASSLVGLVLGIFALAFNLSLTNPSAKHQRDSLQSWTCKFADGAQKFDADASQLKIPVYLNDGMTIPAGFKRLCDESVVSVGLVVALLVLEVMGCAVAGVGILLERRMAEKRRNRYYGDEKN